MEGEWSDERLDEVKIWPFRQEMEAIICEVKRLREENARLKNLIAAFLIPNTAPADRGEG